MISSRHIYRELARPARYQAGQQAGRLGRLFSQDGRIRWLPPPLAGWTAAWGGSGPSAQTFREWWRSR